MPFNVMAFGGCEEDILKQNMFGDNSLTDDKQITVTSDSSPQNGQNSVNLEKNLDDNINNSDSLSSSASMSDSDLTSTDSEDSLALSESESITDVTPLNSPYCDSPLSQSKFSEHKSEDINPSRNSGRSSVQEGCCPPEANVLMQAIEKLEIEAKKLEQPSARTSSVRRRTVSCGGEDVKRIEQENQRLFKRVISQQNRIRTLYPSTGQPSRKNLGVKHQDLVDSDGDIPVMPKNIQSSKNSKDAAKYSRQQKCLSHPSYKLSCGPLVSKIVCNEDALSMQKDNKILESAAGDSSASIYKAKHDSGNSVLD